MKVEIEGVGIWNVPKPVYEMISEISDRMKAAEAEVARLREALAFTAGQRDGCRAEVARLREVLTTQEHATCSCCDRPVNRRIDAVVCDCCYEDRLQ